MGDWNDGAAAQNGCCSKSCKRPKEQPTATTTTERIVGNVPVDTLRSLSRQPGQAHTHLCTAAIFGLDFETFVERIQTQI